MSTDQLLDDITALSFESRMSDTTAKLLRRHGAKAISAPSMQEVPLESHSAVFNFAEQLLAGNVDILLCTTGVGTDMMFKTLETKYESDRIRDAMSNLIIVSRGPKPAKVLRRLDVPITLKVPEPNTWKEILESMKHHPETSDLQGKTIAIQEYGEPNEKLNKELRDQGAKLIQTSIYRWSLPDDLEPLKNGIQTILDREADLVLFTSKTQINHVMKMADKMGVKDQLKEAFKRVSVASIGPVCSRGLKDNGITPDFEPSRPKLAIFINEIAQEFGTNATQAQT